MKRRWYLTLGVTLIAAAALTLGNTPAPAYQAPEVSITMLWDSRQQTGHAIDPASAPVHAYIARFADKLRKADLTSVKEVGNSQALWIHPSALPTMGEEMVREIRQRMKQGTPVVFMHHDPSALYERLGVPPLGISHLQGNTTLVGIGLRYQNPDDKLPHYIVIGTPTDLLQTEGPIRAVNALTGATRALLQGQVSLRP